MYNSKTSVFLGKPPKNGMRVNNLKKNENMSFRPEIKVKLKKTVG